MSDLERKKDGYGGTDWEAFFECPKQGLIPLVSQAKTPKTLTQCSIVVVESLFIRKEDEERRRSFLDVLMKVIPQNGVSEEAFDRSKAQLAEIFRHIKEDRKAKAKAHFEMKAKEKEAEERRTGEPEKIPEAGATPDPTDLFCRLFAEVVGKQFAVLRMGSTREELEKVTKPLPYLVSPDFAAHFCRIIAADIAPLVADQARAMVHQAESKAPGERIAFLREQLADPENTSMLWRGWRNAFEEVTKIQDIPVKPPPQKPKSKGPLGLLKGKKEAKAREAEELAQWQSQVKVVRAANKRSDRVWAEITQESENWVAPGEADKPLLEQAFNLGEESLAKEVGALRQIVSQGGEVARAFDVYRRNGYPDLALLVTSFRYPDVMLHPRSQYLKNMLKGCRKDDRAREVPLVSRYLKDHLA